MWLCYTYYISAEPWSKVSLLKGRKKTQPDISLAISVLYPNGHGVKPKKHDLQKMLPYMPRNIVCSMRTSVNMMRMLLTANIVAQRYVKNIVCIP